MIRPIALANAVAAVVGVHTVNLAPLQTNSPMPAEMFVLGLVSSILVSWVAAYATAGLCRRWPSGSPR